MSLARLFPESEIVAVDLESPLLEVARMRARHYALDRLTFVHSTVPNRLAEGLGTFDAVTLNAVYEHLLPAERRSLLPQLWASLRPGGVLFVDLTPHRYYPLEYHTTGLPLLNYLSDRLALTAARRFSPRVERGASWETLLRRGVRGATTGEIVSILEGGATTPPIVLRPSRLGAKDTVDIWYSASTTRRPHPAKAVMRLAFKAISRLTRTEFSPEVSLAVQKSL